jgi:hypothetical protein
VTIPSTVDAPSGAAVEAALRGALDYLTRAQLPHGEFRTLLASDAELTDGVFDSSPFVTTFVLHALSQVDRAPIAGMVERGLRFLESERELGGIWRYYSSRQWKHRRVPPDLDDTACASDALRLFGRPVPNNRWIFRRCRTSEGRYRSWIVPARSSDLALRLYSRVAALADRKRLPPMPDEERANPRFASAVDDVPAGEVDPVVNANVILYLGDSGETRQVSGWLTGLCRTGVRGVYSPYYPDPLALYYMISRACWRNAPTLAAAGDSIVRETKALQQPDGSFGTPLATALAAGALLTFAPGEAATRQALGSLLRTQRGEGSWPGRALYRGPVEFWGSDELTTALALEGVARFHNAGLSSVDPPWSA